MSVSGREEEAPAARLWFAGHARCIPSHSARRLRFSKPAAKHDPTALRSAVEPQRFRDAARRAARYDAELQAMKRGTGRALDEADADALRRILDGGDD